MSCCLQNVCSARLTYSPPLSVRRNLIFFPSCVSMVALYVLKKPNTSLLDFEKSTEVNREKSSTSVSTYRAMPFDRTFIGPVTSECTLCSTYCDITSPRYKCGNLLTLSLLRAHPSQTSTQLVFALKCDGTSSHAGLNTSMRLIDTCPSGACHSPSTSTTSSVIRSLLSLSSLAVALSLTSCERASLLDRIVYILFACGILNSSPPSPSTTHMSPLKLTNAPFL